MLDMLFLLAILGMLITRKQYTTQEVEKRSKKGTKRVVPIVPLSFPTEENYLTGETLASPVRRY